MTQIRVELQLADGSFTTGMLRAGQSLNSFNRQLIASNPRLQQFANANGNVIRTIQQMDSSTKSFLGTMRDLSIVTGLVSMGISKASGVANGWVGDIVRVNAEMEKLRFQMQAMSNKADPIKDAADNVAYLREQATQMPFSLKTITNAFTKLKATGTDPAAGSLKAIADGVAAFGGSDENLNRIVLGLTQMSGKAVIQMEELRQQLGESMPGAMQLMARSMGISVADLSKEIATGTVEAKRNLENFYAEIERAYGGTAQRMMMTFSGQVSQLYTNFQRLATEKGGAAFFDAVKGQLVDINNFLKSDMANQLATQLGQGLASAVGVLRNVIEGIWNFREQLQNLAMVAATGVGLVALNSTVRALINTFNSTGFALAAFRTNMSAALSTMSLGASGFASLSTAGIGARFALMGAGSAVATLATAGAALAPVLVILGGGIYLLADHFGLLSNKTKTAYEELVKFGAESRKQAADILGPREAQLQANLEKAKAMAAAGMKNGSAYVARHQKELDDFNASSGKIMEDAARREDARALQVIQEGLNEKLGKIKAAYNTQQQIDQEAYQAQLTKAKENNDSKKKLQDAYQEQQLKSREKLHDSEYNLLKSELERYEKLMESGVQQQAAAYEKAMIEIRERMVVINNQRIAVRTQQMGAYKAQSPDDDTKKIERGAKILESLRTEVSGLEAAFNGGNTALGELLFKLQRGDFGRLDEATQKVKELHANLVEATAQKEALDKLLAGQKKAEAAIEKTRQDNIEREFALRERQAGRQLSQAEKDKMRLESGYYDGLGNRDQVKKSLEEITKTLRDQGMSLTNVAMIAQNQTFGAQTVNKIQTVIDQMRTLAGAITTVGSNLQGLDFGKMNPGNLAGQLGGSFEPLIQNLPTQIVDRMKMAMERLMSKGWSQAAASGIVGNFVSESKMNPSARNPNDAGPGLDSVGLGQWNRERLANLQKFAGSQGKNWQDFLTQVDFADWELRNTHKGVGSRLQMAKDAQAAGDIAMREYEVPHKNEIAKTGAARIGNSVQAYNLANGKSSAPGLPLPSIPGQSLALPEVKPQALEKQREMNGLIDAQVKKTEDLKAKTEENIKVDADLTQRENAQKRVEALAELKAQMESLKEGAKLTGGAYQKMYEEIKKGVYGTDTKVDNDKGKELLEQAKALDDLEKKVTEQKRATSAATRENEALERERLELIRRIAEEEKKVKDPNYKADSAQLQELRTRLDKNLENVSKANGGTDNDAYRQALQQRSALLQNQSLLDATTQQAALAKQDQAVQDSLLTQTELRRREYQRQIALIDQNTQAVIAAGGNEVEAVRNAEMQKANLRRQYAQESSPMAKQFKEWGDLQGNLAKQSAQWMDGLADGITGVIMGTTDLKTAAKQLISGILKDLINSGIKKMMADMMGGAKGGAGGKKGAVGAVGSAGTAKMTKGAGGLYHTGGIIGAGAPPMIRGGISPSVFAGARRFHTGGLITGRNLPGLMPSEVPIIAKKGEGVFTPEQMENMGGFSQSNFQVNAPITIHGSSGTPEQNDDLAKKMQRQLEVTMRSVVADEMRKQTKPGNFGNTRNR